MHITYTLEQINEVATAIWQTYKNRKTWAFEAPMGAGKTTLISALCKHVLACQDEISSPTFSIMNEYKSPIVGSVVHADLYRLNDEEEAIQAGVEDALYSGALCLLEWPQKAENILPEDTLYIQIAIIDEDKRALIIQ